MPGAGSRDTSVVVRELFSCAESSVLVAGFAISRGKEIFRALGERMARVPSLSVRMFLNVARDDDERASNEEIVQSFYLSFKTKHWSWEKYPQVFYDPRALETNSSKRASLHPKCIVIDGVKCFVSSANFTESGQARNIEVGALIEDRNLAASIHNQFESLVTHGLLPPFPACLESLAEAHDYDSYLEKLEVARTVEENVTSYDSALSTKRYARRFCHREHRGKRLFASAKCELHVALFSRISATTSASFTLYLMSHDSPPSNSRL